MTERTEIAAAAAEILIVEDSPVEAELLRRTLARAGYVVGMAHDGEMGLQAMRLRRPALVLSDIVMPVMNGYQLCRAIKHDDELWNIPLILLTVLAEPEDIIEAINSGADAYIIKPFDETNLLHRIRSLLESPISRRRAEERREEVVGYGGKRHAITGGGQQILNLLLSLYENMLNQNRDLVAIQAQLNVLNESLDQQVRERTAAIRKLNAELEQRVGERTASLEAANQELEAFAYSVSHDLRAPLRAVDGFSRKVVMGYGDRLDAEGRRQLQVVRDNAQRMGQLIDDLLAFSRMGRRELAMQALDMEALSRSVAAELRTAEPQRAIEFAFLPLPRTQGDPAMIRQVWVNLLGNAVKFSRRCPVAHIEVGGRVKGEEAIYWIADDGAGFDMQYADKLFGVFQRLHRQDEFEGTGVGLAIVQRILQRHNGRIWGEGRPAAGATFSFALPWASPDDHPSGGQAA